MKQWLGIRQYRDVDNAQQCSTMVLMICAGHCCPRLLVGFSLQHANDLASGARVSSRAFSFVLGNPPLAKMPSWATFSRLALCTRENKNVVSKMRKTMFNKIKVTTRGRAWYHCEYERGNQKSRSSSNRDGGVNDGCEWGSCLNQLYA